MLPNMAREIWEMQTADINPVSVVHIRLCVLVPVHAVPIQMLVHHIFPVAVWTAADGDCSMGLLRTVNLLVHQRNVS